MHKLNAVNQPIPFPAPQHAAGLSTCAWCKNSYRSATGFGVFCSRACFDAEAEQGEGVSLRSRDEVEAEMLDEAMAGRRTLTDNLIVSILKAQTARIERLEKKVAGLEGRERV